MKLYFILKLIEKWRDQASKCLFKLYVKGLDHLPMTIGCLMIVFFIPVLLMGYLTYVHYQDLNAIEQRLCLLEKKAKKTCVSRAREASFMKQAELADAEFFHHHLTLDGLLENEKIEAKNLLTMETFKESPFLLKRYNTLNSNKVEFKEKVLCEKNNFREVNYLLKTPIEADIKDIAKLLEIVEGERLSNVRPQLLFRHFGLKRKEITSDYAVYEVDCDLLERSLKKSKGEQ
jgi:hypothetical protein